ncbi:hypothetical protein L2E82_44946 [Cichorium intybus]|uniref:Uncharacterized protein n=1 Tax=Cichorium intybus TaxID=13427 RepID=A0ACB8ZSH7_CICIN|nr:hypothetical protein L2E82_44946 [Cichorium intybus]
MILPSPTYITPSPPPQSTTDSPSLHRTSHVFGPVASSLLLVDGMSLPSPPSATPNEPLPTRILLNLNFSTAMFDFTSVMIISDPMPAAVEVLICGYTVIEKQP